MCLRVSSCCGVNLKTSTALIGIYSALMTVALYCLSGAFIYRGITYHERGEYEWYDNDATFLMYGSLYLIMAAFWTVAIFALFAGIYTESRYLIAPWLTLQILSACMGLVNVICQACVEDYVSFVGLPFIIIGLLQFTVVYSFFMDIKSSPYSLSYN